MTRQVVPSVTRFLSLSLLLFAAGPAFAQSAAIAYQGRLTQAGNPVTGIYDMQFTLFDTGTVGTGAQQGAAITNSVVPVTNGVFTVTLDFGAAVFDGSPRFLEIGVRPGGVSNPYNLLAPRQEVTSIPYAIQSLNAATAATALNVASGSVVKSLNTLKDDVILAAGPNVTITPSGNTLTIASSGTGGGGGSGLWNLSGADLYYNAGNVGIGTASSPTPGVRLEVNGNVRLHPNGGISGGFIQFGTPSGETGMSISGANRADVRFDDSSLKLLAGFGPGAMPSENGIVIRTSGNVGIGNTFSGERLTVGGDSLADTKIEINAGGDTYAALRVANSPASWLWQVTPSNDLPGGRMRLTSEFSGIEAISITRAGNVGIGTTTPVARLHAETGQANTAAVYGNATAAGGVGVYGQSANGPAIHAEGNLTQARDKGGAVKAMLFVNQDGTIARCYNGITGSSTGNCGFSVKYIGQGDYFVDFGFKVDDRFVSVTPRNPIGAIVGASFRFVSGFPTQVEVRTFVTNDDNIGDDTPFMLIIY